MKTLSRIIGTGPRFVTVTATGSVTVPDWAEVVNIYGIGGGQGGGNSTTVGQVGAGGGGGALVSGLAVPLAGATSISVTIGAGGAGAAGGANTVGAFGGNTAIDLGAQTLTLEGGGQAGAQVARPYWGTFTGATSSGQAPLSINGTGQPSNPFGAGASGTTAGTAAFSGFGAYGMYGSGGQSITTAIAPVNFAGGAADGYGSGGGGSNGTSPGGNGAPGLVMLEFIAGL